MQDGTESTPYSAIFVYETGSHSDFMEGRSVGEHIEITATVMEYYGLTELQDIRSVVSMSSGHALTPLVTTTGAIGTDCTASGEAHEGLLVTINDVALLSEPDEYDQMTIDDGSGTTLLAKSVNFDTTSYLSDAFGGPLSGQTLV